MSMKWRKSGHRQGPKDVDEKLPYNSRSHRLLWATGGLRGMAGDSGGCGGGSSYLYVVPASTGCENNTHL